MEPLLLIASGLATGLITSLVGLPSKFEFPMWIALYVGWFLVLGDAAQPLDMFLISTGTGVIHGGVQVGLLEQYKANNPWSAEEFENLGEKAGRQMFIFSVAMGAIFGGILAGIAWVW